jgi:hypothetical protein
MSLKPTIRIKRLKAKLDDSPAWSLAAINDELFISLMDVKVPFCTLSGLTIAARKEDLRNLGRGVLRRFYEEQARYKMYRIPIFRPPPVFVVYLKHLDHRLKHEISTLDRENRDFVLREAISKIFCQLDERFFLLSVKPLLKWRLES